MEYFRLSLQVPQSPGVVKTAQNQQNMLQSAVNLTSVSYPDPPFLFGGGSGFKTNVT